MFLGIYLLSRLISPAEFGRYSAFQAMVLAVYPLLTLRYEYAIPVARSDGSARALLTLSLLLSVSATAVLSVGVLVLRGCCLPVEWISPAVAELIPLMGFAAVSASLASIFQLAAVRTGALRAMGVGRVLRAVCMTVGQVALALIVARGASSLIVGELVANLVLAAILAWASARYLPKLSVALQGRNIGKLWAAAKRFRAFALVSVPHAVSHQALVAIQGVAIGVLYGPTAMGHYFLMRKVLFSTIGLVSTALYQVCFSEASKTKGNHARLRELWTYSASLLAIVTIPIAVMLLFLGEQIFALLFGTEWASAGSLAAAAFPIIIMEPIAAAMAFMPAFLKRQPAAFGWSLTQNIVGIGSVWVIFLAGGRIEQAILGSSLAVAAVMLAYVVWLRAASAPSATQMAATQ
ncbi:hypothetical protein VW23_004205 [Devosia insulae DS-56]|uniref:Polysaccharide biosynthesis protein C-terminal domain-containing protein n=1 Tax=Devosia insulae DS-56 TaxID=1116389 RepID=A0A1E5XJ68_9HYPH|nr:hypothetical protein VW23_004205 [Devosia insulae DS-56]